MASGSLESCSLHGWIPVFTVQGRWQTGCMASCGWAVCWCQRCGSKWPMVALGLMYGQVYVMDNEHSCILLMAFWMHKYIVSRSRGPLLCHSSMTFTSCCSMIMHGPKDLYTIPGSWEHPSSCMASILTGHVTHWACLRCSGSAYTTACSNSGQYPATSHSHWRGVDQHSTSHNQQPDQLYTKEMCCTAWGKWWSHPPFSDLLPPPHYSKTAHFRVAFYCGQPKAHLCNNHAV